MKCVRIKKPKSIMRTIKKLLSPIFIFLCLLIIENKTFAVSIIVPPVVVSNTSYDYHEKYLNAREFVKLTAKEFGKLSGIKLNWYQKLSFVITKSRLKHDLKKNPELKITDYHTKAEKGKKFNFLWFILGIAGPVIGVFTGSLILFGIVAIVTIGSAYITKDKGKINSAWKGLGVGILAFLLVLFLALISLRKL